MPALGTIGIGRHAAHTDAVYPTWCSPGSTGTAGNYVLAQNVNGTAPANTWAKAMYPAGQNVSLGHDSITHGLGKIFIDYRAEEDRFIGLWRLCH